jgi:crotonobetainyl-CoA:carnitine CoA-transferase CaiB-like acyl-CoA transferase
VSDAQSLSGPLAALRVLELADEKGQFCGKLFGDLGADVVKIEPLAESPAAVSGHF